MNKRGMSEITSSDVPGLDEFRRGQDLRKAGDHPAAQAAYRAAAEQGNVAAMINLASSLNNEDGDVQTAITWLELAVESGSVVAKYNLGAILYESLVASAGDAAPTRGEDITAYIHAVDAWEKQRRTRVQQQALDNPAVLATLEKAGACGHCTAQAVLVKIFEARAAHWKTLSERSRCLCGHYIGECPRRNE